MAIFTTGPLAGSISGNVGGVSFANPSGSKVIRKPRRTSANSAEALQEPQKVFRYWAKRWQTRDENVKQAWRIAASQRPRTNRLGVQRQISGFQLYMHWNCATQDTIEFFDGLPPNNEHGQRLSNFELTSSVASGQELTFDDADHPGSKRFTVFLQLLWRDTVPKFNRDYGASFGTLTLTEDLDMTGMFSGTLGAPILGQVIAVRVYPNSRQTDYRTSPIDLFAVTTA